MPVVAVAVLTPPSVLGTKICCCDYIECPKPEIAKLVAQRPVVQVCMCADAPSTEVMPIGLIFTLSTWMYPRFESVNLFRFDSAD